MSKLKLFLSFLYDLLTKGPELVPRSVRKERMDICKGCPYYNKGWCDSCGCYLNAKVAFKVSECPVKNWDTYGDVTLEDKLDAGWE